MRGRWMALAVVVAMAWSTMEAKRNLAEYPQLRVFVMNDADASTHLLLDAERQAARVLLQAGVDVEWVNRSRSSTFYGDEDFGVRGLIVRIVPRARTLNTEVFGVSFLDPAGNGTYADIFLEPIVRIRGVNHDVSTATILGNVMTHEVGHLLLGSNAHTPSGIMRGHWEHDDLLGIRAAEMQFTKEQAQRIKGKVLSFNSDPDSPRLEAANR